VRLAVFATVVWLMFVWTAPAYAYVDPGSGGMLLQLLLGGAAGAALIVRVYWRRFLKRIGLRDEEPHREP
jgi:hypothetical protein